MFSVNAIKGAKVLSNLPTRVLTIGGTNYNLGGILSLEKIIEVPNPSDATKTFVAIGAELDGKASIPVSLNTVSGIYFDENKKRCQIDNGLPCSKDAKKSISDILGTKVEIVGFHEFSTLKFGTDEVVTGRLPLFKVLGDDAKASKAKK